MNHFINILEIVVVLSLIGFIIGNRFGNKDIYLNIGILGLVFKILFFTSFYYILGSWWKPLIGFYFLFFFISLGSNIKKMIKVSTKLL